MLCLGFVLKLCALNKSTGYSLFHLCFGHVPTVLPPLVSVPPNPLAEWILACEVME